MALSPGSLHWGGLGLGWGRGSGASRPMADGDIGKPAKQTQDGPPPKGWDTSVFEETMITDPACHMDFRGSLRSSSKRVPNNPSPNGVLFAAQYLLQGPWEKNPASPAGGTECPSP